MKQLLKSNKTLTENNDLLVNSRSDSIASFFNHNAYKFFKQELIRKNTSIIIRSLFWFTFWKTIKIRNTEKKDIKFQIKAFRLFNIWSVHRVKVISVDKKKIEIITAEKNNICKVWNHKLTYKKAGEKQTKYTDE